MNIILIYFSIKYKGDWNKIYDALENKEKVSLKEIKELESIIKENNWNVKTIIDVDYPKKLKTAYKPPFVIWWKGDINLLEGQLVAITGDNDDSKSLGRVKEFIKDLGKETALVGQNITTLDKEINKLSSNLIYVTASGIDEFQFNNFKLVLSEYPYNTHPSPERYKARNRVLASIADSLVLINSKKDGKINHLVSSFLNLGKDIYAYPGEGDETDGNSELIKQGAQLITSYKDIA